MIVRLIYDDFPTLILFFYSTINVISQTKNILVGLNLGLLYDMEKMESIVDKLDNITGTLNDE